MKELELNGYQIRLRTLRQEDLEQVRLWRNNPSVSQFMLSEQSISTEQQQAWFNKLQRDESQLHFMIEYKGNEIGVANIRSGSKREPLSLTQEIEPGLYIADEGYRNNIIAFAPTLLLNDFCFNILGCAALTAVVKASNKAALNYNLKLGYQIDNSHNSNDELVKIRLNKTAYEQHTRQIKALLSRPKSTPMSEVTKPKENK